MKLTMGPEMRYGKALFELSKDNTKANISDSVSSLLKVFEENDEISSLLKSGKVSNEDKKNVLVKLLDEQKAHNLFKNFVSLMCDKSRATCLAASLSWFKVYEDAASGVVKAFVKTTTKLSASQKKSIEGFVKDKVQGVKSVELEETVDTSLLAGLRVRIGSVEYDMSVRGRLDDLRTSLN
ncbi:MAG: ATP synthase F1 subunit delta [Magnetococcales bacterium]|nr:ATP synthase F1 subunit delta [Magnetococcales bacterium]|tara:strand:+ start:5593 stop:6135 length:543 start_codon:yes stop_codon:yes gene_type:complete